MFVFLYDSWLNQKKYQKLLIQIEAKLTDLGLMGRFCRLNHDIPLKEALKEELRRGLKTLVIVGNDYTISQVINLLPENLDITIGIIPVGSFNEIANGLGVNLEDSCQTLAARRIIKLDTGLANNYLFLKSVDFSQYHHQINIDDKFSVKGLGKKVLFRAMNFFNHKHRLSSSSESIPHDNLLELIIKQDIGGFFNKKNSQSSISFTKINFKEPVTKALIDGVIEIKKLNSISVSPRKFEFIIGKHRSF